LSLIDTRTERTGRTAFYIAALVAAYLAAAALVTVLVSTIVEVFAVPDLFIIGSQWAYFATNLATSVAVFALGVFLVLWLLAPISPEISLRLAIGRGALAVAGGAAIKYLVDLVTAVWQSLAMGPSMFGGSFPNVSMADLTVVGPIQSLVGTIVTYGPVVLLATVLVWLRLRALAVTPND
jgi:hypothetical protein